MAHTVESTSPDLFGIMAEFEDEHSILQGAEKAREAGYTRMDAYTPFPVHGLAEALNFTFNWIPYIVLAGAIIGGVGGFLLQWYGSVIHYPLNIGGRPLNSWPAFLVITFETAVLGAAGAGVLGLILLNNFPMPYHPVFNVPAFQRASRDRFFLCIMATDPQFDLTDTRKFMESLNPTTIAEVEQDEKVKVYE